MNDNRIRQMVPSDWEAVATIYEQGMKTNLATFQTQCPSYEEWNAGHVEECRLVVEAKGQILGWAALSRISSRPVYRGVAELSIYIHENARGKGVGRELLQGIIQESEEKGFWTLQSGIMDNNKASLRLHEICGFRVVGYRERIGQDAEGTWRNTVLMERRSIKG